MPGVLTRGPSVIGASELVVGAFPLEPGFWFPAHDHAHPQILWTPRGVVAVAVADERWVLPPTRALWMPAGVVHRTGSSRGALLHSAYLHAEHAPRGGVRPVLLAVSPLLAELIRHLRRADLTGGARTRAEAVLLDLLHPLPAGPLRVAMPSDARAVTVARALHDDPADGRGLAAFARYAHTSPRTLSRLFVAETGLSFERWRTGIRMWAALPLLADGHPVTRVAHLVGYATASAFLAAFRRTVGTTPSGYLSEVDHG
ncbi:MAG TPA: helix-turn-helix transcriptional regulator [Pseudonocardia sp.]